MARDGRCLRLPLVGGVLGGVGGWILAPYIVRALPGEPAWAAAAVVAGAVGVCLLLALLGPSIIRLYRSGVRGR